MYALKNKPIAIKTRAFSAATTLMALGLVSACTATQQHPGAEAPVHQTIERFEAPKTWQVNNCYIEAEVDRVRLKTDASVSHNTIRFAVLLPAESQAFLQASLLGVGGVLLNVTGRKDRWSLELPNSPHTAAEMIKGKVYLLLTYKPVPTTHMPAPAEKTVVFPLKGLPEILAEHEAMCP